MLDLTLVITISALSIPCWVQMTLLMACSLKTTYGNTITCTCAWISDHMYMYISLQTVSLHSLHLTLTHYQVSTKHLISLFQYKRYLRTRVSTPFDNTLSLPNLPGRCEVRIARTLRVLLSSRPQNTIKPYSRHCV